MLFFDLPDEVLINISSKLNASALARLSQTSNNLKSIANDNVLWHQKLTNNFRFLDIPYKPGISYKNLYIKKEHEHYKDLDKELIRLFKLLREGDLSKESLTITGYANYQAMLDHVIKKEIKVDNKGHSIFSAINNQGLYDVLYDKAINEYHNDVELHLDKSMLRLACKYNQAKSVIKNFLPDVPHGTLASEEKNISLTIAAKYGFINVIILLCQKSTIEEIHCAILVTVGKGQEKVLRYLLENYNFDDLTKAINGIRYKLVG